MESKGRESTKETAIGVGLDEFQGLFEGGLHFRQEVPVPVGSSPIDFPSLCGSGKDDFGKGTFGYFTMVFPMWPHFLEDIAAFAFDGGIEQLVRHGAGKEGFDPPAGHFIGVGVLFGHVLGPLY